MNEENIINKVQNKNVLITGGLGFIGSNIAVKLVEYGANVTLLDSNLKPYGSNMFNINGFQDKINIVDGDIRDKSITDTYVKNQDIIFSLASQVSHFTGVENPFMDLDINCKGHLNILESSRVHAPHTKIIYSGSRMEYGKILHNPVTELHPTNPDSINYIHKLTAEKYYLAYFHNHGLKTTCFRITNPYGPRSQMKHSKYSVMNWFIRQAIDNQDITIFGEGRQLRDYIYIEDMTEAMILSAVDDRTNGEVYNLGSGAPTQLKAMVEKIVEVVGSGRIVMKDWPESHKGIESGDFYADISKLRSHIDWTPKTGLIEGIRKTADYYKQFKEHYW